jgi:predicted secreted hydrolase
MRRRAFALGTVGLGAVGLAALGRSAHAQTATYPTVRPGRALEFPRDHGAHPEYRIEWWYLTGWLRAGDNDDLGLQITFFRLRPAVNEASTSAFAPRQLLFAHAALADPKLGRLMHEERSARAGLGLAEASESTTAVNILDWRLRLDPTSGRYFARLRGREIDFDLVFAPTRPIVLQGEGGFSRKGPRPEQASYYYSRPHLAVSGRIKHGSATREVRGAAWLDHEWSSEIMAAEARGWDWIGLLLADGGSIMAYQMRDAAGRAIWAAATIVAPDGTQRAVAARDIAFEPRRMWRSPRTRAEYPVALKVRLESLTLSLEPLIDDQELDTRSSVGIVYWEGAVRALVDGREIGRGYLELTGYVGRVRL